MPNTPPILTNCIPPLQAREDYGAPGIREDQEAQLERDGQNREDQGEGGDTVPGNQDPDTVVAAVARIVPLRPRGRNPPTGRATPGSGNGVSRRRRGVERASPDRRPFAGRLAPNPTLRSRLLWGQWPSGRRWLGHTHRPRGSGDSNPSAVDSSRPGPPPPAEACVRTCARAPFVYAALTWPFTSRPHPSLHLISRPAPSRRARAGLGGGPEGWGEAGRLCRVSCPGCEPARGSSVSPLARQGPLP